MGIPPLSPCKVDSQSSRKMECWFALSCLGRLNFFCCLSPGDSVTFQGRIACLEWLAKCEKSQEIHIAETVGLLSLSVAMYEWGDLSPPLGSLLYYEKCCRDFWLKNGFLTFLWFKECQ